VPGAQGPYRHLERQGTLLAGAQHSAARRGDQFHTTHAPLN
jgi:hypothetical protein